MPFIGYAGGKKFKGRKAAFAAVTAANDDDRQGLKELLEYYFTNGLRG
jgi:hypothetical protein